MLEKAFVKLENRHTKRRKPKRCMFSPVPFLEIIMVVYCCVIHHPKLMAENEKCIMMSWSLWIRNLDRAQQRGLVSVLHYLGT
jgi:hypothetical protein